jgi:hypothetical protein
MMRREFFFCLEDALSRIDFPTRNRMTHLDSEREGWVLLLTHAQLSLNNRDTIQPISSQPSVGRGGTYL